MKIIKIDFNKPDPTDIKKAARIISQGGIVVYPSDTSYGLAANALDPEALEKIFCLKGRDDKKPISSNVRDIEMIKKYAKVSSSQERILKKFLPGPYTFILSGTNVSLSGQNPSFRIPGVSITDTLSKFLDIPYTATSANLSGEPNIYKSKNIIGIFQDSHYKPDLFLDAGDLSETSSSTVVDLTQNPPKILRQGSGIFN